MSCEIDFNDLGESGFELGDKIITIREDGTAMESGTIAEFISKIQSVIFPPLTTAERDLLTPETPSFIFNTDTGSLNYFNGTDWVDLHGSWLAVQGL